jgi:hypothetical protein
MKIELQRDWFGYLVVLINVALLGIVPFVVVFWAISYIAPWWVSIPLSVAASFVTLIRTVKLRPIRPPDV